MLLPNFVLTCESRAISMTSCLKRSWVSGWLGADVALSLSATGGGGGGGGGAAAVDKKKK